MYDLVIRQCKVAGGDTKTVDIAIKDGVIAEIAQQIRDQGALETDCEGKWLFPGAIDMHVHLRDPGLTAKEDLASGTSAGVNAGVTTVADMPNTVPPTMTESAFLAKVARAREVAHCNVMFYMGLGKDNLGEIEKVSRHPSFAGIKVFLGATTGNLLSDRDTLEGAVSGIESLFVFHAELDDVMKRAKAEHGPGTHARDHALLRPVEAAVEAVGIVKSMAGSGRRLHVCHVSSAQELAVIGTNGDVTCEVTPHHLWFSANDSERLGNFIKMNPPVRTEADNLALRTALSAGRIAAIATDHAPHGIAEKNLPYPDAPSGVPGLDTLVPSTLQLVKDGVISMTRAVEALSGGPARLLRLGSKGRVAVGYDADLFLWDQEGFWTPQNNEIRSKCGWTPFEGMRLAALPRAVWLKGRLVVDRM